MHCLSPPPPPILSRLKGKFLFVNGMSKWNCQAVVAQTAFTPVIAMELLEEGIWKGAGVLGPEAFDPIPFMERMAEYGFPYGIRE